MVALYDSDSQNKNNLQYCFKTFKSQKNLRLYIRRMFNAIKSYVLTLSQRKCDEKTAPVSELCVLLQLNMKLIVSLKENISFMYIYMYI